MRRDIDEVLKDKAPRLVKLTVEYTGDKRGLADAVVNQRLRDLDPEEVFLRRYRRDHEDEPAPELLAAFRELVDEVRDPGRDDLPRGTAANDSTEAPP